MKRLAFARGFIDPAGLASTLVEIIERLCLMDRAYRLPKAVFGIGLCMRQQRTAIVTPPLAFQTKCERGDAMFVLAHLHYKWRHLGRNHDSPTGEYSHASNEPSRSSFDRRGL